MTKAINKLHKLKAQQGVQDAFNACNSPNIIQILLLILNLGSEIWIF